MQNPAYNFETLAYAKEPVPKAGLALCWQPVESGSAVTERGRENPETIQAVVHNAQYGRVAITQGDKVVIGTNDYRVTKVAYYPSYRLVTAQGDETLWQK